MARIDPELTRQLADAGEDDAVGMVVHLKRTSTVPVPEETQRLAEEIIERTSRKTGDSDHDFNVFPYLGSFAVSARPRFLRLLTEQPEVMSAVASHQPGDALIQPVRKRPASIEELGPRKLTQPRLSRKDSEKKAVPARKLRRR